MRVIREYSYQPATCHLCGYHLVENDQVVDYNDGSGDAHTAHRVCFRVVEEVTRAVPGKPMVDVLQSMNDQDKDTLFYRVTENMSDYECELVDRLFSRYS